MKQFPLLCCFLISITCFGQLDSDKLKLIEKLNNIDYAESENVGYDGEPGQTKIEFHSIKGNLNNDDLFELAKNYSPPLRLYSSLELIHRNDKRIIQIYKEYKNNNLELLYKSGCTSNEKVRISDLILEEFDNILKKRDYVRLLEENLEKNEINDVEGFSTQEFVKFGNEYLDKVITKDFHSIHKKILKIKSS